MTDNKVTMFVVCSKVYTRRDGPTIVYRQGGRSHTYKKVSRHSIKRMFDAAVVYYQSPPLRDYVYGEFRTPYYYTDNNYWPDD